MFHGGSITMGTPVVRSGRGHIKSCGICLPCAIHFRGSVVEVADAGVLAKRGETRLHKRNQIKYYGGIVLMGTPAVRSEQADIK